jgi:hypothetical protein
MSKRLFTKLYIPLRYTNWSTGELLVMTLVGIIIGISLSLMTLNNSTTIKDYEIIESNFLGYKELMVIKTKE